MRYDATGIDWLLWWFWFVSILQVHHGWGELDKDVPESLETSSRLAVCNMDWDHVSAQDLFGGSLYL